MATCIIHHPAATYKARQEAAVLLQKAGRPTNFGVEAGDRLYYDHHANHQALCAARSLPL
jgi:hypothetical protein